MRQHRTRRDVYKRQYLNYMKDSVRPVVIAVPTHELKRQIFYDANLQMCIRDRCKYFTIVCKDPTPICDFIHTELGRSATLFTAEGTYSGQEEYIVPVSYTHLIFDF